MKVLSSALLVGTLLLSACAVATGPVEVTRFNRASDGIGYGQGSFTVAEAPGIGLTSLPYLSAVSRELQRIGYSETGTGSDVIAQVGVEVVDGLAPPRQSPVSVGVGGSTGSYGSGLGLGIGINLGGGPKASVTATLSVRLVRRSDNLVIWEGRAVQVAKKGSPAAQPGIAASKLAAALFKDFPGKSGETISVP